MTKSIFILWDKTEYVFKEWKYVGGGETRPVMEAKTVTVRCRYSSNVNDEMLQRANDYAATMSPESYGNVRVAILDDSPESLKEI